MNFKEACTQMLTGKQVRRSSWTDRRYRMKFGASGELLTTWDDKGWRLIDLEVKDLIANDWEIYEDADYQCNHTLEWAIEQMQAGKYCTIGGSAKYAVYGNALHYVADEKSVACTFSLNFLKPVWGLYKEP